MPMRNFWKRYLINLASFFGLLVGTGFTILLALLTIEKLITIAGPEWALVTGSMLASLLLVALFTIMNDDSEHL